MPKKKERGQGRKPKAKRATTAANGRCRPPADTERLRHRIAEMQRPVEGHSYYAVTIVRTKDGKTQHSTQTRFDRFVDSTPRRELRMPCEVIPERMTDVWVRWGQPYLVVTTRDELDTFLILGGNALVDVEVAKSHFRFATQGFEVYLDGVDGSIEAERVAQSELRKAPSPRLRMAVLKRDAYRCAICGRRAADNIDIELNLHHVRPISEGGLTKRNNLLTLCRTCHKGLDPHYEHDLFNLHPEAAALDTSKLREENRQFHDGVRRYRRRMQGLMRKAMSRRRK